MRGAPLLFLIAAACGGGDDSGGSWDDVVDDFVDATCVDYEPCTGADPVACDTDVRTDLADARDELDDAGEAACIDCLAAKAAVIRDVLPACQPGGDDIATIIAACDTDPAVDFDGDGTADNDDDEACNGHP
jgi:hypothetical protein